jgi:hypothetical protein
MASGVQRASQDTSSASGPVLVQRSGDHDNSPPSAAVWQAAHWRRARAYAWRPVAQQRGTVVV